jgi:integrase
MTLADFKETFLGQIRQVCQAKPRTVEFWESMFEKLLSYPKLASSRLIDIDEALILKYREHRGKAKSRFGRPMAAASINRELACIRRAVRMAQEMKLIQRIPRVRLLRGEGHREFVLSREMEAKYLEACPKLLHDAAVVLIDSGLRLNELLTLSWPEVHLEPVGGASYGFLTVLGSRAKSSKARSLPLSSRVVEVLKGRGVKGAGFVFSRDDGSGYTRSDLGHVHAKVRAKLIKAEIAVPKEFVLHSLRHTFGTRLGENGADAFVILRAMGHSSIDVSARYVHPTSQSIEAAIGRMFESGVDTGATQSDNSGIPESSVSD